MGAVTATILPFFLLEGSTSTFVCTEISASPPLLFWRYDHKRCPSPRPPHQHLGVVGVRSSQSIGRDRLLVVENVGLLLVGSTDERGPGAKGHVWIHGDVDPHPPPHCLQHNALLQKTRSIRSLWYSFVNGDCDGLEVAL